MKAAAGQREPPNRGTTTDINVISTLIPYCDAMFIDDKARAMYGDIQRDQALTHSTRLFSPNNRNAFLEYLKQIERDADPAVIEAVREVYGADWPQPFLTMYEERRGQ